MDLVIAELHGRLGNQLFQFASSFAIAEQRGARLRFSTREIAPDDLLLPRLIGDHYVVATPSELASVGLASSKAIAERLRIAFVRRMIARARRTRRRTPAIVTYRTDTGRYRPEVFDLDLPVCLKAHLESERYFEDVRSEILEAIRWPAGTADLPTVAAPTVAVSFRRGDFNSLQRALPLAYYERALDDLATRLDRMHIVLFGDDEAFLELAGKWTDRWGPTTSVLRIGRDPITQLRLMTQCEHAIIANSSFAWWGAWLGDQYSQRPDRIVVAPVEYVGGDRVPARWTTVPAGVTLKAL